MTDDKENCFEDTEKSCQESRIIIDQTEEEISQDIDNLKKFLEIRQVRKDEDPDNLPRLFF